MFLPNDIKIFNTNEIIKNEFFFVKTSNKIAQNSINKNMKINLFFDLFNNFVHIYNDNLLPNFITSTFPIVMLQTECDLEKYRVENFENYPSRLNTLFVFSNIEDAKKYREELNLSNANIMKVHVLDKTKVTKHNMEYVSVLRVMYNTIHYENLMSQENLLQKYWIGEGAPFDYFKYGSDNGIIHPRFEYLIEGEYIFAPYKED